MGLSFGHPMPPAEYEFLRRLTEGAAAEVYLARPRDSDRRVIFEILRPELRTKTDVVSRFLSEARSRTYLVHPNVALRVAQGAWKRGVTTNKFNPWGKRCKEMLELVAKGEEPPRHATQA